jgi:ankyrin repeat protein
MDHLCESLHFASENGHSECIKILLDHGANVHLKNNYERTSAKALHIAVLNGHIECMKILLDHRTDINDKDNNGCTPLHWASQHENLVKL